MEIKIIEYDLPMVDSGPYGVAVDFDGAIWFAEEADKIGQLIYE